MRRSESFDPFEAFVAQDARYLELNRHTLETAMPDIQPGSTIEALLFCASFQQIREIFSDGLPEPIGKVLARHQHAKTNALGSWKRRVFSLNAAGVDQVTAWVTNRIKPDELWYSQPDGEGGEFMLPEPIEALLTFFGKRPDNTQHPQQVVVRDKVIALVKNGCDQITSLDRQLRQAREIKARKNYDISQVTRTEEAEEAIEPLLLPPVTLTRPALPRTPIPSSPQERTPVPNRYAEVLNTWCAEAGITSEERKWIIAVFECARQGRLQFESLQYEPKNLIDYRKQPRSISVTRESLVADQDYEYSWLEWLDAAHHLFTRFRENNAAHRFTPHKTADKFIQEILTPVEAKGVVDFDYKNFLLTAIHDRLYQPDTLQLFEVPESWTAIVSNAWKNPNGSDTLARLLRVTSQASTLEMRQWPLPNDRKTQQLLRVDDAFTTRLGIKLINFLSGHSLAITPASVGRSPIEWVDQKPYRELLMRRQQPFLHINGILSGEEFRGVTTVFSLRSKDTLQQTTKLLLPQDKSSLLGAERTLANRLQVIDELGIIEGIQRNSSTADIVAQLAARSAYLARTKHDHRFSLMIDLMQNALVVLR